MQIIVKLIILYLVFRLLLYLLRKGAYYYRAYRVVQLKKRQQAAMSRKENFNLNAFDVEDADYEEIKQDRRVKND